MKRVTIGVIACIIIAAAVFIPVGIYTAKQYDYVDENDRLLKQYERDFQKITTYRDEAGYIDSIDVATTFYLSSPVDGWATQYGDVKINAYFNDSFDDLSDLKKCQVVYDCTKELRHKYSELRDKSEYMAFRKEHAKGDYLKLGKNMVNFSGWCSVICNGDGMYQYYNGNYYVNGSEWDIDRDGDVIRKVSSPFKEKKETTSASNPTTFSKKQSSDESSGSEAGDLDDQDVESYYQDYRSEFEDEDDAWDDLEDHEDEWD